MSDIAMARQTKGRTDPPTATGDVNPWAALAALCIGFFMILVDSTIVSVATPALMNAFQADVTPVMWVTSAYLLAFAVPLLITGRLGDRFGPKKVYLVGLVVFTLASLWCGMTSTLTGLVIARVVQGLGAALMNPQTMSVITRVFPATRRGQAMGVWGAVAGVATLVGPLLGGVLIDGMGWEWIFFVNVPVGVVGFVLAWRLVPDLPVHSHAFDWLGVALSAAGMFCVVFAVQEGRTYDWGTITGIISVPLLLVVGAILLVAFVVWQARNRTEPLVPLGLFRDRNFSLSNVAIATVGFAITSLSIPYMIWAQVVRGWTPTQAALTLAPMAVLSGIMAPFIGRLVDRAHPRWIAGTGLVSFIVGLVWLGMAIRPGTSVWVLLGPILLLGVANGCMWSPISSTATRNLPMSAAGAGSGVYNTTRQVGAVLGSAAIASMMEARIAARLPGVDGSRFAEGSAASHHQLPPGVGQSLSQALGESLFLPAAVLIIGLIAVLSFVRPSTHPKRRPIAGAETAPIAGAEAAPTA